MKRRDLLKASTCALAGLSLLRDGAFADAPSNRFDYAALKGEARALAMKPYAPPARAVPPSVAHMSWDRFQSIRFRPERALWANDKLGFRLEFFHLGMQFRRAVRLHEVVDGVAREIAYDPALFDLSHSGIDAGAMPRDLGFAGFRVFVAPDFQRDIAAFLGASYFRAVGATMQYGLSARGLAIDCGLPRPEEFPDFTAFWFERPAAGARTLVVFALLDSPSVAGAYRFEITPGEPLVMRVDSALYPRRPIERLGIAPLTSMFLCAPNDRRVADDWRPAIHDSDGLALATGKGEWIWRPLVNPASVRVNAFADENPRGFGLLQRDRNFDHYQDDGVWYDRRPSLWVEPLSGFDRGAVELVEIPIGHESFDNIVAFWNPAEPVRAGTELLHAYRLHWGSKVPATPPLAEALQTWTGIGGQVGGKRAHFSRRFVVDFAGGDLASLGAEAKVEPVITLSAGQVELASARPLASIHGWRAMFDVRPPDPSGRPIDIRMFLRSGDRALTETWLYQWVPLERA
ncbi:MAG TPA: glucan biosynthesis protein D [Rhodanobacteraceae bacterium]